jgi:hypothetical protein
MESFHPIAEREFKLRGPADRSVIVRIGSPEPNPARSSDYRCPYQVVGLSKDEVQYACGVDSFQALNLAFAGIRNHFATNAEVLATFHDDFSLKWEDTPWEVALPRWAWVDTLEQSRRLERFLEELWSRKSTPDE